MTSIRGSTAREVKRDLEQADSDCAFFEQAFKGRLAALGRRRRGGPHTFAKPSANMKRSTIGSAG